MAVVYKIKGWDETWENSYSRKLKRLDWVKLPVNLTGSGYLELMEREDGAAIFGTWCALAQVAAGCDPRGHFVRSSGVAHDVASLSRITRIPAELVQDALSRLIAIGWIECGDAVQIEESANTFEQGGRNIALEERRGDKRYIGTTYLSRPDEQADDVECVYSTHKEKHPRLPARPSRKHRALIRARLDEGYSVEQLQAAIHGNHVDPHCCGQNERGREYHDLGLIFRDADRVVRFQEAWEQHKANGSAQDPVRHPGLPEGALWISPGESTSVRINDREVVRTPPVGQWGGYGTKREGVFSFKGPDADSGADRVWPTDQDVREGAKSRRGGDLRGGGAVSGRAKGKARV